MLRAFGRKKSIKDKHVTIIGVGGIGANTALQMTQAGVGKIKLIDFDRIELCNLNRGQVFTYNDIGKYKAEVAARAVEKVNDSADIETVIKEMASYEDISEAIEGTDFVVRCADKPIPMFNEWFNRACVTQKKPFISGGMNEYMGVYGPMYIPGRTACMQCWGSIGRTDFELLNPNDARSPSWGPLMGFIGDLMANDIIAYLNGRVTNISINQIVIDSSTMAILPQKVLKNENCPSCGVQK